MDINALAWGKVDLGIALDTNDINVHEINVVTEHYEDFIIIAILTNLLYLQRIYYYDLSSTMLDIVNYDMDFNIIDLSIQGKAIQDSLLHIILSSGSHITVDISATFPKFFLLIENFPQNFEGSSVTIENSIVIFAGSSIIGDLCTLHNKVYSIILDVPESTLITISDLYISPSPRYSHTLKLIRGEFYLFGGSDKNSFLGDMWKYNPITDKWTLIKPIGNSPSARYLFASDTQGDALLIWGGNDANGLKNDIFLYNVLLNTWTEMIAENGWVPSKRKAACIVLNLPYAYLYGGIDSSGICSDLWRYNFGNNTYKMISTGPAVAYTNCMIFKNEFYVIGGSTYFDAPYGKSMIFSLSDQTWRTSQVTPNYTENVFIHFQSNYFFFGGRRLYEKANNAFIYSNSSTMLDYLNYNDYVYSMAFTYYNKSIYYHGGNYFTTSFTLFKYLPLSRFSKVDLGEICTNYGCTELCSEGTYLDNGICVLCPPGSFAENVGNSYCTQCGSGFYNPLSGGSSSRQCYPCPEGTYNDNIGAFYCKKCPAGSDCPTGSKVPVQSQKSLNKFATFQPDLYTQTDSAPYTSLLQYIGALLIFLLIALINCVKNLRLCIVKLDIFDTLHNHEGEIVKAQKNFIGGVFSVIYFSVSIIVIGSLMCYFFISNINEAKSLIPIVILQDEIPNFAANFEVKIEFHKYGDSCVVSELFSFESIDFCNEQVFVDVVNVEKTIEKLSCDMQTDRTCVVFYQCIGCQIGVGAFISVSLSEKLSYASSISVNVTSDSSIPESRSSVFTSLVPPQGYILIGAVPSEFSFTMTPSYFRATVKQFPSLLTGYHVSQLKSPEIGSINLIENLSINTQLNIIVSLQKVLVGLYTSRDYKQSELLLASTLFGTVTGLAGITGFLMVRAEKRIKKKIKDGRDTNKAQRLKKNRILLLAKYFYHTIRNGFSEIVFDNPEETGFSGPVQRNRVIPNNWFNPE